MLDSNIVVIAATSFLIPQSSAINAVTKWIIKEEIALEEINEVKKYKLMGPGGNEYRSEEKGTLGGHRKLKIYGRLDCPSALRHIDKGHRYKKTACVSHALHTDGSYPTRRWFSMNHYLRSLGGKTEQVPVFVRSTLKLSSCHSKRKLNSYSYW